MYRVRVTYISGITAVEYFETRARAVEFIIWLTKYKPNDIEGMDMGKDDMTGG